MPLEGQMQGIGDAGWAEDFDQAWANRMIRDYGVSMEDLRDPGTRTWLNRQQRQKQQKAAAQPQTGGAELKPGTGTGNPYTQSIPGQTGKYGGINPGGAGWPGSGGGPGAIYSQPGGAQPGPQTGGTDPKPGYGQWTPASPYGGYNPGGQPGQRPRPTRGNIFQDPGRQRTATSAFTLSTNQR